jgi:imidazolonepropionase-like amidohydrolase
VHHGRLSFLTAVLLVATANAQDVRPVAFTNARIVTVSGKTVESGTLVIKDGKITALGPDVPAPAGARIVDATGLTILPGLVSAVSRAGFAAEPRATPSPSTRRRQRDNTSPVTPRGSAQNSAATKVVDSLHARQDIFGRLLRTGITSLALSPQGSGLPGLGAVLRPDGRTLEDLTADDDAFVQIDMTRDGPTKKLLKEAFEKAQKLVEERKQPPKAAETPSEPKDKPAAKPAAADAPKGEAPKEEPKPQPRPEPEPKPAETEKKDDKAPPAAAKAPQRADPNLEVLADLLEGKRRAILQIDSAADLQHWQQAVDDEIEFPRTLCVTRHDSQSGTIEVAIETVKSMKCAVLLPPDLSVEPRTAHLTHPAKQLHDAGIEVGFVVGDNPAAVRFLFYRLMHLVRSGLPRDVALRGVTLVPAKALGIDEAKGSLEVGKDADLLLFRGDPLDPSSELLTVWLAGHEVEKQP